MSQTELKIAWATHEAAKYACVNWHYSECVPMGKLSKVGVWEDGVFIGVVIFGYGASPKLGEVYKLVQNQCVELVRIALDKHKSQVSRIVSIAIKWMYKNNQKLRLIVSFADTTQGHHGGIYQAGNWTYTGQSNPTKLYIINGKSTHVRALGHKGVATNIEGAKKLDKNATVVLSPGKHRYLMPLDKAMKIQIATLAKPYPKRTKEQAAGYPPALGGATPTCTLHIEDVK